LNAAAPVLSVRDLARHFAVQRGLFGRARATVKAVDGVDFDLAAGRTFALVGESGCGKSTVARLLLRLIAPTRGSVRLDGDDLLAMDPAKLRAARSRLQIVFQDPYGSLNPRMTAGAMLAEPLMLHAVVPSAQRATRVAELLAAVGLRPEAVQRYPHEFSGGQRQRLAIARALAAGPRVIVCDEPVSALDVSIQAQILNLLADLQRQRGLAYVFISHDLSVVRQIADEVAVMYLGRFVETGPVGRVLAHPHHPYTQALLAAAPVPVPGLRERAGVGAAPVAGDVPSPLAPPPGCTFHPRCPHARDVCRTVVPVDEALPDGGRVACHRWRELAATGADAVRAPLQPAHPALVRLQAAFASPAPLLSDPRSDPASHLMETS
jgi:oligopeptide/dipeptide ABC transporter ATP-binding protein